MFNCNQIKKGFTLIELLVVIAIIGVLATLSVVAINSTREKSRNAKRIDDINKIATALELYYADEGSLPAVVTPGQPLVSPSGRIYLSKVPSNPTPRLEGNCLNEDYTIYIDSSQTGFIVFGCISQAVGGRPAGTYVRTSKSIFNCGDYLTYEKGLDKNGQYKTVQIGSQCWLAENLNVGVRINNCDRDCDNDPVWECQASCDSYTPVADLVHQTNNGIIEKFCYENKEQNCARDGGFYNWAEAMNYASSNCNNGKCRGICPPGWHIPTENEWRTLENYLKTTGLCASDRYDFGCAIAGDKLKHADYCADGVSCNSSGFNLKLISFVSPDHAYNPANYGADTCVWAATSDDPGFAWQRCFNVDDAGIMQWYDDTDYAFPVRCIKD